MPLEAIHKTIEEIPQQFQELYSERNGQFELTGVAGIKTLADVERLNLALSRERNEHKDTKTKAQIWGDLDYEETIGKLDRIPELEAAAGEGGIDEEKMNQLVEGRIASRLAPTERENKKLKEDLETASGEIGEFKSKETKRLIHDSVRAACVLDKVEPLNVDDVLLNANLVFEIREDDGEIVTKDNVGVTPGIRAIDWLIEMKSKKSWWPPSHGSGAGGGGGGGRFSGDNPWSADGWNVTKQGLYVTEHGQDKATAAAKSVGSTLNAIFPPAKK